MTHQDAAPLGEMPGFDAGEYCREVENHLTRANGGHLVRVVGPAFELVRQWAAERIPLSVVCRGIDQKADRHRAGGSSRPLRLEFCEADVREVYDAWRRAVGVATGVSLTGSDAGAEAPAGERRRPSLRKHLDRAIERLARTAGRLDVPAGLPEAVAAWLQELTALRDEAAGARGPAREEIAARLAPLDGRIASESRAIASPVLVTELTHDAETDLEAFRGRLSGEAWQRAVDATVDRLLRDRFGLPTLTL